MEKFPHIDIIPGIEVVRKVGRFVASLFQPFHEEPTPMHSNHYRGAAELLDRELDGKKD